MGEDQGVYAKGRSGEDTKTSFGGQGGGATGHRGTSNTKVLQKDLAQ